MIEWIKNLRSTERGRTLFKLSLYMLFLFFVIVLCMAAGAMNSPHQSDPILDAGSVTKNPEEEKDKAEKTGKTYFDKQKLFEGDYEFVYDVYAGGLIYNFIGGMSNGIIDGFREDGGNLIHYKIENGVVYKIDLLKTEELPDFYIGLDEAFFNFTEMFSMLNASSATIASDGENKIYNYVIGDVNYKVVCSEEYINKIEITKGEDKYDLSFKF